MRRELAGACTGALLAVLAVVLLFLAADALAADSPAHTVVYGCTSPDQVTLDDLLAQATWTAEVGKGAEASSGRRTVDVAIALPALHSSAGGIWRCLHWNAELVLSGATTATGATGLPSVRLAARETAVRGDLGSDDIAYFRLLLEPQDAGKHFTERAWLRVWLRNPTDPLGHFLRRANGSPFWLFPVTIHL